MEVPQSPAPQTVGVPATISVELVLAPGQTWDEKAPAPVHLAGTQSGLHDPTVTYLPERRILAVWPERAFLPGETVRLTVARTESFPGALLTFHVAAAPGPARFEATARLAARTSPSMLVAADIDADGDPDLAVTDVMGEDAIHIFLNDGGFVFADGPVIRVPGIENPSRFALSDLDRDGHLDLIVPGESSGNLALLRGRGDGRFTAAPLRDLDAETPVHAVVGDLDLDGHDEVLIAHLRSSDRVTVLPGEADGALGRERRLRLSRGIGSLALADLDGDNDLDLAAANEESSQVVVLRNQGDGRFELARTLHSGDRPETVLAADLNGDHIPDLVTTNQGSNDVMVFLARAKPEARTAFEFAPPVAYATGDRPFIPAIADLDGDGDLDIAVPGLLSDDVTVLLNQSDGTFALGTRFTVDAGPVAVQAADFDGDGVLDLAVASSVADNVTVWRNTRAENPPDTVPPAGRDLEQNVPNPFNPATEISFTIEKTGQVTLVIFNSSGKIVRTLVSGVLSAGKHVVAWDGTNDDGNRVPSGTYFYRLTTADSVELKRMTLLR